MRAVLDYGCIVYESASATLLKKLDIMQAKALRLILGAVKTTPIAAIQVESSEMPLHLRREKLAMAYWINLQGQREDHPVRDVLNESWETVNKPGKGFAWKIKKLINETDMKIESNKFASVIVTPPIAPWLLEQPEVDLNVHKEIKGMEEGFNLKAYVKEYIKSMHYSFLQIYTDGSKNIETGRTGAAFFIPEFQIKKAGRITDGTSVYTAEMVAILMALEWVYEVRPDKVITCSDSVAVLMSLQSWQSNRKDI